MRIAVLTNDYPPVCGGAGRIAALQFEILKNVGHDVRVWHKKLDWPKESAFARFRRHLKDLSAQLELVKEISNWKPELLITHNLTGCGFGTPKKIQKTGTRWIHVLHDVQLFEPSGQLKSARRVTQWQIFWIWLRFFALGFPDIVISPTKWLLKQHQRRGFFRFGKTQCEVLPNPGPAIKKIERKIHDPIRLLFVGRLAPEKGSRILLAIMKARKIPFELHVVGDGPDADRLRSKPHVVMHGLLDSSSVLQKMEECDALLFPSQIEENQPTVILEAASRGLPTITSLKQGIRETGPGMWGTSGEDGYAWTDYFRQMIDYPGMLQDYIQTMYHIAEEHDPNIYREKFLSLLKSN